jgi:HlyD family secretion protein
MLKRRWLWGAVAAAVVAAVGVAGVTLRAPQVDVVVLQPAPLVRTLQFSARVATLSRVNVGATLTGRVARVNVDEGAQVRRGDVLVQLETAELQAAVAQASAAEQQAQARLAGLRSTGRTSAAAGLLQAQATLRAAEADLERTQQLVKQGFLSESKLDEVRRAVEVARAQQTGAQAQTRANQDRRNWRRPARRPWRRSSGWRRQRSWRPPTRAC